MNQPFSVELQLLLACARVRIDTGQRKHIQRLIAAGPDWESLIMTARRHGLCSLLHCSLRAIDQKLVPTTVVEQLTTLASNYRRRNLVLVAELLRVVGILEKAGIGVIPYKGPAYRISPLSLTNAEFKNYDPAGTNVTYCWTGQTSSMITAYLTVLGYDATSLKNGANAMIYSELQGHTWAPPTVNYPVVTN